VNQSRPSVWLFYLLVALLPCAWPADVQADEGSMAAGSASDREDETESDDDWSEREAEEAPPEEEPPPSGDPRLNPEESEGAWENEPED